MIWKIHGKQGKEALTNTSVIATFLAPDTNICGSCHPLHGKLVVQYRIIALMRDVPLLVQGPAAAELPGPPVAKKPLVDCLDGDAAPEPNPGNHVSQEIELESYIRD